MDLIVQGRHRLPLNIRLERVVPQILVGLACRQSIISPLSFDMPRPLKLGEREMSLDAHAEHFADGDGRK